MFAFSVLMFPFRMFNKLMAFGMLCVNKIKKNKTEIVLQFENGRMLNNLNH